MRFLGGVSPGHERWARGLEQYATITGWLEPKQLADEMGRTSVPGVYAAGDMVSPMAAVIVAAASGTKAAAMLNHEFVMATPKPEPKGIETPV